jgi:triphosphatase
MPSVPHEIELKLRVHPDALEQLRANSRFESLIRGDVNAQSLRSTYYDFEDLALRRNQLTLRIRQIGPHRVQTLKSAGIDGAPYLKRMEIELPVEGDAPDLRFLEASPLASLVGGERSGSLRPVFEAKIERKTLRIEHGGAEIEFAFDTGEITSSTASAAVSEIELELKHGDVNALFAVASVISGIVPVELSLQSKADVGFGLFVKEAKLARLAEAIEIAPDMMTADAFKVIARMCVRHLLGNLHLVQARHSEAIHQTRVALRRFRVALSVFSSIARDERLQSIKNGLKHFAQQLGPARDLDVLTDDVLKPFRARHPKDKGAASLVRAFSRQRTKAHAHAVATVQSPEFHRFVINCTAWIETGSWSTDADAGRTLLRQRPVAVHAAEQIGKRRKRCRKFERDLRSLTDADRHRVRISVKKLRYTVEFFESLYASGAKHRQMKKLLRACQRVQDSFGALNDLAVRRELFAKFVLVKKTGALARAFSAGMLLGEQEHEVAALKKKASRGWKAIHKAKPFWKISATQALIPTSVETTPPSARAAA